MSEGPIKQWRDSYLPKRSTSQARAVHLFDAPKNRALCGRKVPVSKIAFPPNGIATCADCLANAATECLNGSEETQ